MNEKRLPIAFLMTIALMFSLMALAACSQPAQSSKSEEKLEVSDPEPESSKAVYDEPFYVLIVGNDTRVGTVEISDPGYADGNARSDTMMLARVDPVNYQVTLLTISRDTKDWLDDGTPGKLNARYQAAGINELLKGVEALTGVKPRYYLNSTFVGFEDIVNKLGGISMYVPVAQSMVDIVSGDQIAYPAGEQDLNGAEALVFARERKKYRQMGYDSEEAVRQTNDRAIMQTIMQKILDDPASAAAVSKALISFVDTNWDADDFEACVSDFAENADAVTFLSGTGPYQGGIDAETGLWLAYRDEDAWREVIAHVDAGGDPNDVIAAPSL